MVFAVPASKASRGQDKFEFSIPGTEGKFAVKKMKFVQIGVLAAVQDDGELALNFFSGATKKQSEAVRTLETEQFQALVEAWRDDSEVTAGE